LTENFAAVAFNKPSCMVFSACLLVFTTAGLVVIHYRLQKQLEEMR